MHVTSLGYRTDLMLRALEGSQVTDHGDHLVIRTPANPGYWWGNFLLLAQPPRPAETGRWLAAFATQFPAADHLALGIDGTDASGLDPAGLLAAGLVAEHYTVLTATTVHDPPHPPGPAAFRQLAGDDDWRQAAALRAACQQDEPGGAAEFIAARIAAERALTEAGHGAWFGAFRDGLLLAQLGLIWGDGRIARYQNVETHPAARRQGLAGTLVCQAGRHGREAAGVAELVIVADPDDAAIRVYHSVGFTDTEVQTGFLRAPGVPPE